RHERGHRGPPRKAQEAASSLCRSSGDSRSARVSTQPKRKGGPRGSIDAVGRAGMKRVSAAAVRDLVLSQLSESLAALGLKPADVPDDFDLLTQGATDSLGIVQMIAALDEHFGIEI